MTTDHADPDDQTSMVLPVIGDTVLLTDGTTSKIRSRVGNTWKVRDDLTDHEHIVTLDQIAGYPDDVAWVRGQFDQPEALPSTLCPRCGGRNGNHGLVHTRHGNGGGHNAPCPNTPTPAEVPAEFPPDDIVAGVLNAAIDWHAATSGVTMGRHQPGGSFIGHAAAADALHDAVRAYLPTVTR